LHSIFVNKQPPICKDIIRVAKHWRNYANNPTNKLKSYLLELLVIRAYQTILDKTPFPTHLTVLLYNLFVPNLPFSFFRLCFAFFQQKCVLIYNKVFLEFLKLVRESVEEGKVFVFWEEYYKQEDIPKWYLEKNIHWPVVLDVANPIGKYTPFTSCIGHSSLPFFRKTFAWLCN